MVSLSRRCGGTRTPRAPSRGSPCRKPLIIGLEAIAVLHASSAEQVSGGCRTCGLPTVLPFSCSGTTPGASARPGSRGSCRRRRDRCVVLGRADALDALREVRIERLRRPSPRTERRRRPRAAAARDAFGCSVLLKGSPPAERRWSQTRSQPTKCTYLPARPPRRYDRLAALAAERRERPLWIALTPR